MSTNLSACRRPLPFKSAVSRGRAAGASNGIAERTSAAGSWSVSEAPRRLLTCTRCRLSRSRVGHLGGKALAEDKRGDHRQRKLATDDLRQSKPRRDLRKSASRRCDGTWRKLRLAYFAENPHCVDCIEQGRVTAAQDVHQEKTINEAQQLRLEWLNLRAPLPRVPQPANRAEHRQSRVVGEHDIGDQIRY